MLPDQFAALDSWRGSPKVIHGYGTFSFKTISQFENRVRPRLHEQIKHTLFPQICPELLGMDREFEQLKEVLFAHVYAA